jgi:deazaflavin-dependent oxidoreductase (nitroreductase family)
MGGDKNAQHIIIRPPRLDHQLIMRLAALYPISWVLARILPPLDSHLLRLSSSRLTMTSLLTGLPVVMLTTTGARSGLPRSTPLVALPQGSAFVLIASNFGNKKHPAWFFNLRANPAAILTYYGFSAEYVARQAQGTERERCWQSAVAHYPGFAAYARRAGSRQIPVLILEPPLHPESEAHQ